jgi:hypothetical protein
MANANSITNLIDLDFDSIKNNLKTFLKSQDVLKDYNYEGSALSVLLDVLAYNTQYNAYYLNMVANETFIDSAVQRGSVVSQAKLLNYTPKSPIAPEATINLTVNQVTGSSLTLPSYTNFLSSPVNGKNYNFVTTKSYTTTNIVNGKAEFTNIALKQGKLSSQAYTVNTTTNPKFIFEIPDTNADLSTLTVLVQESSTNTSTTIFNKADNFLVLNGNSLVYFVQENTNGYFEVYFGDGILGKKLNNGNIVKLTFISTDSVDAHGANSFYLMDTINGFANTQPNSIQAASNGSSKETIDQIKFYATKNYAAQNRAVTKNDYATILQQNNLGITFDSVNVWGGEENDPPVYGQIFLSLKPSGSYNITQVQKKKLIDDVIKPISVVTVTPNIVDPDYIYVRLEITVYYDPYKTIQSPAEIADGIRSAIYNFADKTLNKFNSSFNSYLMLSAIQNYSSAIVANDFNIRLEKKFYPTLGKPNNYKFYFNTPLEKGVLTSGITSKPPLTFTNTNATNAQVKNVYLEELPTLSYGIESISINNPGYNYQLPPTIMIYGDGTGATAEPIMSLGTIRGITITNAGNNYTSAVATVVPQSIDNTGTGAALTVNLQGRYGTIRSYYFNDKNVKTILNDNAGKIDYVNGIIELNSFNPLDTDDPLGELSILVTPKTTAFTSKYNKIITIDASDSSSVAVTVIAQK